MEKSVSVVIPAYNERENIEKTIRTCLEFLPNLLDDFEILVVDDGSKDGTREILENLKNLSYLKVFHHLENKGMGFAVKTGIENGDRELIFTLPADLQYDISEIRKFLPLISNADIVIGSRSDRNYGFFRSFCSFIYCFLLRVMFGLKYKDPTSIKMFKREVFDKIAIESSGFFWETEVLIKAKEKGLAIKEVNVFSNKRIAGRASGNNPKKIVKVFLQMLRFYWNFKLKTRKA